MSQTSDDAAGTVDAAGTDDAAGEGAAAVESPQVVGRSEITTGATPESAEAEPAELAGPESTEPVPLEVGDPVALTDVAVIRRAPRYGAFIWAGILLAALLAAVLVATRGIEVSLDPWGLFLLTWVVLAAFTVAGSVGLALVLDRRSMKGSTRGPG